MNSENKISRDLFEKLCSLQCDTKEILGCFGVTVEQLNNWCLKTYNTTYENIYKIKSIKGKIALRNLQFKMAEKSPTMAIYLGKVYLNQDDKSNKENNKND